MFESLLDVVSSMEGVLEDPKPDVVVVLRADATGTALRGVTLHQGPQTRESSREVQECN